MYKKPTGHGKTSTNESIIGIGECLLVSAIFKTRTKLTIAQHLHIIMQILSSQ
jgi:hypothetical protein